MVVLQRRIAAMGVPEWPEACSLASTAIQSGDRPYDLQCDGFFNGAASSMAVWIVRVSGRFSVA